jgi:hypothetical protein
MAIAALALLASIDAQNGGTMRILELKLDRALVLGVLKLTEYLY